MVELRIQSFAGLAFSQNGEALHKNRSAAIIPYPAAVCNSASWATVQKA